ncbi:hypothetical protein E7Y32_12580 [Arthrobacter sp. UKPF54-2]|uniref:hypothetical protein n=1 Tax=Arthrobacter sp. UKPF54-2 TaxID=2600159 RepID=UPI0011B18980|nr:hypothetical protein [Arthrobacter sp. UKPF54-2]QDY90948.1 hypothetical protein E7Y32_12580 [Arthrobacter sp. UKPF54-2]
MLSDEELMALVDRAINGGQPGAGRVSRSADLRTRLQGRPAPAQQPAVEPGECGLFRPHSAPTSRADLDMNFAAGVLTLTGTWSREAVAFVLARSAPRDTVVAADFAYTDKQAATCASFRQDSPDSPPATVRLLTVPELGERAYALVSSPAASADTPPADGTVSLQVLMGTVSLGLSRQVQANPSDEELQSALAPLLGLARMLVRELAGGAPGAAPPATSPTSEPPPSHPTPAPPPSRPAPELQTPEQVARLLQGITGPNGSPAQVLEGRYTPAASAPPADPAAQHCIYDDAAYLASLGGAATVVAEIPGTGQAPDQISLRLIGLPDPSPDGSAFDRRAADLAGCTTVQEHLPSAGSRTWSPLKHPTVDTSGQTGYAVVYMLPDGTGVRHVLVGARKGRLCVETETKTLSDGAVQQAADGLAATINKVMARVGG